MSAMERTSSSIGVIGAGAWGTALAIAATRAGHEVMLWAREPELVREMRARRENTRYLPGVELPAAVQPVDSLAALEGIEVVLLVAPAQATRAVLRAARPHLLRARALVLCAKGIERGSGAFLTTVAGEEVPDVARFVLSGPSFAAEVARGLPAAVTLAGEDIARARALARQLAHQSLRIYSSDDPLGVQIGGAMKNVLAIACGIVEGRGLGDSARAALLTRAFAELARFGAALGAKPQTLTGLSGLGDLMLTATSTQSRNYSLGVALGRGEPLEEIMARRITVAEGVHTAQVAMRIARAHDIDMPICAAVHAVVSGQSGPDAEIARLLARPLRDE